MKININTNVLLALSFIGGCVALLACPSEGLAAKASVNASATVVAPVTISTTTEMFFEKLSKNSFGSVLILGSSYEHPARETAGQSYPGAAQDAAIFIKSSGANPTYTVTFPQNVAISDGSSNDATLNTIAGNSYGAYILSGTHQIISVVGKLNEDTTKVHGNYKGKLNFTVYYN